MRSLVFLIIATISFSACKSNSGETHNASGAFPISSPPANVAPGPAIGDDVLYMFDEYHFYEAKLVSQDGTRAKLRRDGEAVERDMTDIYPIPKAGDKITVKAGDFVAARYGSLPTWPTAEVVKVDDNKITVKRIISGSVEELSPEKVLAVSPSAAAKIREAAKKK
jgi:hypothetical protein